MAEDLRARNAELIARSHKTVSSVECASLLGVSEAETVAREYFHPLLLNFVENQEHFNGISSHTPRTPRKWRPKTYSMWRRLILRRRGRLQRPRVGAASATSRLPHSRGACAHARARRRPAPPPAPHRSRLSARHPLSQPARVLVLCSSGVHFRRLCGSSFGRLATCLPCV
jgi:hypothetical protein